MKTKPNNQLINSGLMQDFDRQIQGAFKNYSRGKINIFKDFQTNVQSACVNTQDVQNTEHETLLGMLLVYLYDLPQSIF